MSSPEPQIIHCLDCSEIAKKEWDEAVRKNLAPDDIVVTAPKPAYTYQVTNYSGFPCLKPVCLEHLQVGKAIQIAPGLGIG